MNIEIQLNNDTAALHRKLYHDWGTLQHSQLLNWIELILTKGNSMTLLSFRAALLLTFSTVIFLFITVKLLLNDLYFMVIWF